MWLGGQGFPLPVQALDSMARRLEGVTTQDVLLAVSRNTPLPSHTAGRHVQTSCLAVSSYLVVAILWPSGKHGYTLGNDRDET